MPSDKPRITLRLDREDMDNLEHWAKEEFLTTPQLARVIVKKAIAEYLKRHSSALVMTKATKNSSSTHPQPPTASKTNGKEGGKRSQTKPTPKDSSA